MQSYHDYNYCVEPDLDHTWHGSHRELNYGDPNKTMSSTSDGFVRENEKEEQNEDDTMGYYNEEDLPYYYKLAETFAVSDSNFCDLIGPTSPNRFYSLAATSFGHVVTPGNKSGGDTPPAQGFQPINGTIFDRLDAFSIKWSEYYDPPSSESALYPDVISETMPSRPYGHVFRPSSPNYLLMSQFYTDAAAGNLAQVVWIDLQYDEHPPADIRSGQQEVAQVITAIRNSPAWSTSIVFFTYDVRGGAYNHVKANSHASRQHPSRPVCGQLQSAWLDSPGRWHRLHGEFYRRPVELSCDDFDYVPGRLRAIQTARYQGSVPSRFHRSPSRLTSRMWLATIRHSWR